MALFWGAGPDKARRQPAPASGRLGRPRNARPAGAYAGHSDVLAPNPLPFRSARHAASKAGTGRHTFSIRRVVHHKKELYKNNIGVYYAQIVHGLGGSNAYREALCSGDVHLDAGRGWHLGQGNRRAGRGQWRRDRRSGLWVRRGQPEVAKPGSMARSTVVRTVVAAGIWCAPARLAVAELSRAALLGRPLVQSRDLAIGRLWPGLVRLRQTDMGRAAGCRQLGAVC